MEYDITENLNNMIGKGRLRNSDVFLVIKWYRGSGISQRRLAAVCLYCEKEFKRVKGFASMPNVIAAIEAEHGDNKKLKSIV